MNLTREEQQQAAYYAETAAAYEATHVHDDEHALGIRYMIHLLRMLGARTVLDVGSGTGRAIRALLDAGFEVTGIEPVKALIDVGERSGVPAGVIREGRGQALPFTNGSFDAVCEFGVLHHVKKPNEIVQEMIRVSRFAVFLSDTNRFGRASIPARLVKLAAWKSGLWPAFYFVWTRGKSCDISECDGIAYSYSVFDSYGLFDAWADHVLAIPIKVEGRRLRSWAHPLLTSSHVLLCALRDKMR